jgi:hypothetical protein
MRINLAWRHEKTIHGFRSAADSDHCLVTGCGKRLEGSLLSG